MSAIPNGKKVKGVHVSAYTRFRKGQLEHVCAHWRSYPSH